MKISAGSVILTTLVSIWQGGCPTAFNHVVAGLVTMVNSSYSPKAVLLGRKEVAFLW